jgi:diguanylate cyclase (GGDEF)-like protein
MPGEKTGTMELNKLLRNAELFAGLNDKDIEYIVRRTEEKFCKQGDVVFLKGSASTEFYIIKSGAIVISQESDDGKKHDLTQFEAGDSFGEFSFITGAPRDVEARAKKDSTLIVFPVYPCTLDSLSLERPKTICSLYLRSLAILTKRLQSIRASISDNSSWVKQLQDEMNIDQLTGLFTKQYLNSDIPRLVKPPAAILIVKPDRFKELNEIYGHQAGDAVLSRIGELILDIINRRSGLSARAGYAIRLQSNEMAMILERATKDEAIAIARSIGKKMKTTGPGLKLVSELSDSDTKFYEEFNLTASISIGFYFDKRQNLANLISKVYHAMHKIWNQGGNKISVMKVAHGTT